MSRVYHVLPAADRDLHDQAAYLLAEEEDRALPCAGLFLPLRGVFAGRVARL
jgi:hypothetical protein